MEKVSFTELGIQIDAIARGTFPEGLEDGAAARGSDGLGDGCDGCLLAAGADFAEEETHVGPNTKLEEVGESQRLLRPDVHPSNTAPTVTPKTPKFIYQSVM